MNKPIKHRRVERYLEETMRWLGLGHVRYTLRTLSCARVDEARQLTARVTTENHGMDASFEIATGRPWEEVRQSILHECCHVAVWELREVALSLRDVLGSGAYDVLYERAMDAEERLAIRLGRALNSALKDQA